MNNDMMKNTKLNFIDKFFISFIIIIIIWIVILLLRKDPSTTEDDNGDTVNIITEIWNNEQSTWYIGELTWSKVERDVSLSPMENVNNIMKNGIEWQDYITKIQNRQPNIYWNAQQNNQIMHPRLYNQDNRLTFSIPTNKKWIMLVKLKNAISSDRDMFLAVNGTTMGLLHKDKALWSLNNKEYIFNISKMYVANRPTINFYDYMTNNRIQLWVFVGQKDNYVESITMIFY